MQAACPLFPAGARPLPKVPVSFPDPPSSRLTIDRRRAEFADRDSEACFIRHFLPERNAQLKTSLLFAAAFYVAFAATDFATLGDTAVARMLMVLRVGVALVGLGGYAAVARRPCSWSCAGSSRRCWRGTRCRRR